MNKSVIVAGAGVVGLACGKELSGKGYEVFIAEQEKNIATQTSARNSGVIHAGIYYPTDSLKAKLCVRGKNLLYEYCEKFSVAHSNTKKMIVATTSEETQILLEPSSIVTMYGTLIPVASPVVTSTSSKPSMSRLTWNSNNLYKGSTL